MGDSDILNYQPGQTVTFYKEVKDGYGQRTDDGYIPAITRVVLPGFITASGYPQSMSRLDVGLYFFQLVIPQGAGAVGTYLVDIVSLDPNSLLLVNDSRQIVVTAPYGNYSASTVGSGGPSGLPGPPGPMGPQGPPGPYGAAGGDLSGTYPNPKVISIQGHAVSSTTPTDGYVLTWSVTDGYWHAAHNFPITVPNVASLTSINATDGHAAFVQSVLAPWYFVTNGSALTINHITIEATTLGGNTRWVRDTNYHHTSWAPSVRNTWYIDPVVGNDENDGATSITAIKTWGEYIRRLGQQPAVYNTTHSIHWLNDQLSNADPINLFQYFHNSVFQMDGVLIQVDTGTFGAVTNINRASNITTTAFNANGAAAANYWTQYLGFLVHDTTNDTWFRVDRDLGNRQAQLTCPYVGATSGINLTNAPGTITAGNSYVIYRFPKVYVGTVAQHTYGEDLIGSSLAAYQQFTHLHFVSSGVNQNMGPQFTFDSTFYALIQECLFDGFTKIEGSVWEQTLVYNCYFLNGFFARETTLYGGGANLNVDIGLETAIDGDMMIHSDMEIQGNVSIGAAWIFDERPGHGFVDVPLWSESAPDGGSLTVGNAFFGTAALWGGSQLRVHPNGKVILGIGVTATSGLLNTGGILIDGISTGAKIAPGSKRLITDGIPITPSNIDSVVGGWNSGIYSSHSNAAIIPFVPTNGSMPLNFVYIDPVNGSDTNQGGYATAQASPAALKTWAEFERRVGSSDPTLFIGPVIQYLSSPATPTADPIRWTPFMQRAAWVLIGTRTLVASGTLGVGTAPRNQTTGATTHVDLSAFPAAAVGMQVENTTAGKAALAIISASLGAGIFEVYQPLTQAPAGPVSSYVPGPSMVNTWASGDTFKLWQFPSVSILEVGGVGGQYNPAPPAFPCSTVRWLHIVSPDGPSEDNILLGSNVSLIECVSDAEIMDTSGPGGLTTLIWGCSLADVQGGPVSFYRVMHGGGIKTAFGSACSLQPDLGVQFDGPNGVLLSVPESAYAGQLGDVLLRTTLGLTGNWVTHLGGYAGDVFHAWGSGMIDLVGLSRFVLGTGTTFAVDTIKCVGGIRLNNQTVANAINPATGAWSGQIALTPANIDLAFASGGFGGYAINPCGACITKQSST